MKRWIATGLVLATIPTTVLAENRCGWLINPTPRNWTLVDAENEWTIMVQGGYSAKGMDKIRDMAEGEYVRMNYSHGYACFCMNVSTSKDGGITQIYSSRQLSLSTCRRDPALSEPGDG
ncbi:DUF4087 domain-containing protein [Rhizobium sp. XQZ8]|uniref:DUF4087 domain-containing protein n=1 Tax=Rhizobium populisoli TaxID=2859785 RepID=UPI001C6644D3|nr:DUF4087 domain-containing protein [Rhizobium populisoli]MBW6421458.1 DUF4087 domain-containing protein [Rhizobium populisoli]